MSNERARELKEKAVIGTFWTGGGQAFRQIIQVVTSIALARLLVPEDFGLIAMAMVFVGVAQLIADFGIGAAIVQRDDVSGRVLSSCFWINILVAGVFAALLALFAGPIALIYGNPQVEPVLRILSVSLLVAGLMVLPRSLLFRHMDFQSLAMAQVFGTLLGSLTAVSLAWSGWGVGALIAQPIVGGLTELFVTWLRSRWLPGFCLDVRGAKDLIGFSVNVLGTNLLNFANRNADDFIVGKVIGTHAAGIYSFAYQLMLYPLAQVSTVIVKVLFPTLSQMKHDLVAFRETYLGAIRFVSLVTFPAMSGLWVVSDIFVPTVFGAQWNEMTPTLQVFCFVGMIQSITTLVGTIFMSTGHVREMLRVTVLQTPILIAGFIIGALNGLIYVAVIYAILSFVFFFWLHFMAFRFIELPFMQFVGVLMPQLLCAGLMVVGMMALGVLATDQMLGPGLWLLIQIIGGVLIYGLATLFFNKPVVGHIKARFKGSVADSRVG